MIAATCDESASVRNALSCTPSLCSKRASRETKPGPYSPALDLLEPHGVEIWQVLKGSATKYRDNITGQPLHDEIGEYFNCKAVWDLRPWAETRQRQGKRPIKCDG